MKIVWIQIALNTNLRLLSDGPSAGGSFGRLDKGFLLGDAPDSGVLLTGCLSVRYYWPPLQGRPYKGGLSGKDPRRSPLAGAPLLSGSLYWRLAFKELFTHSGGHYLGLVWEGSPQRGIPTRVTPLNILLAPQNSNTFLDNFILMHFKWSIDH